jgi:hypothetical protein
VKIAIGSVLVTDDNGEITSVSTNIADQVLVSQNNITPIWKKIQTINIGDREITTLDIANNVIGREHLRPDLIVHAIGNGIIRGENFVDQSITSTKFENGSINSSKLGVIANYINVGNFYQFGGPVKKQHVQNNTITVEKFSQKSIGREQFNKVKCITAGKIAANTFNDSFLLSNYLELNASVEHFFTSNSLSQNFKLTRNKLGVNTQIDGQLLSRIDFAPDVAAAFLAKGCL